jgi:two-component system OmpR family response regulator
LVRAGAYEVIILDRMLPHVDGLTILQDMRAIGDHTPVLILSALGETDDRVEGLRRGGDDYLAKPFSITELLARVDALGRRPVEMSRSDKIVVGDLHVDLIKRQVRRGAHKVELTSREFRLLEYLLRSAGRVVTRSMILEGVWDYRFDPQTNIVDQHVSRLRQKLAIGSDESIIRTVRGVGYSIVTGDG